MRKICLFILLAFSANCFAQLQSPEQFLGYKVGTKYTPHWKVVSYFQQVAAASPATVKLEKYGETNEGRPLMLAFIATPENLQRLDDIRKNNLRLTGTLTDKPADENSPAIVWLSYNVHGNEASSTEASMLTLYALVNPAETRTKEWLKNTVVVIDPCINPDGRDRYVNWYNSVVGKNMNVSAISREHSEPWPGGRTNHYNFDLNRDWAWQTQIETQQRMKQYNQWLPQVHVDFHEQGYNQPYYFAPAAEPFHEVITNWQREFQNLIGKNNAKYFDANGWLYFTKERFDLFYPSYGDTYPIYNGAIGMTFEQGGIRAGLGIINQAGDTLTLVDRATHHFTNSLSTIEVSSANAARLVKEFKKFYTDARTNGVGEYKTYVIKATDKSTIGALLSLLNKNDIQFSYASKATASGYNYLSGKEESFNVTNDDIVISAYQPRSTLLRVLFEPKSKISDSATYDITAWSLPYAYGLQTYGCKQKLATTQADVRLDSRQLENNAYAYAVRWNGVSSAKLLGALIQAGVKVRFAENAFAVDGRAYDRGTLIITHTSNKSFEGRLGLLVNNLAAKYGVQAEPVSTGFVDKGNDFGSPAVHIITKPNVVLLTGNGVSSLAAGEIWHFFEQQLDYPISLVNAEEFGRINLADVNVIIMPDGNYKFISDKGQSDKLKEWVSKGGKLIALENAAVQLANADWGMKLKKDDDKKDDKKDDYASIKLFEERERDFLKGNIPGSIYKVELDNTHPLAFGYPKYYYTLKMDDNMGEFMKDGGWNVGVIKKDAQIAGFVGYKLKEKLKDGLLFGVQDMGSGHVVYLLDDIIFRSFWENGKLMLCNAVFLVGQ
ncbi:MAG: zinc carboxypeptidase [Sphingobacteriales bacterium]|nr:MAG: zinc carboxypeptidase [Sphingobacteriales bacterium]